MTPMPTAAAAILVLTVLLYALSRNQVRFLSRFYSPIGLSLCALLFLSACLVQGLVRQESDPFVTDRASRIGLRSFKDSAFLLSTLLLLAINIGMLAFDRLLHRPKRFSNLVPLGIYVSILTLLAGSANLERYDMILWKGPPVWRVNAPDSPKGVKELPFAVQLTDFRIDYANPTLYVVNTRTGLPLPQKHPEGIRIDIGKLARFKAGRSQAQQQTVADWEIRILDYIPQAWIKEKGQGYECFPSREEGWAPAVKAETRSLKDGKMREEWVFYGSIVQIPLFIRLDSLHALGMGKPQASDYHAEVTIYRTDKGKGEVQNGSLGPNRPLRVDSYRIYLKSYKDTYGFWDPYVTLELVKDPWEPFTLAGLALVLIGIAGHFFQNLKGKKKPFPANTLKYAETDFVSFPSLNKDKGTAENVCASGPTGISSDPSQKQTT